jgi:S-adenosyl-L-methionine hydrolase (adenosine-forming)
MFASLVVNNLRFALRLKRESNEPLQVKTRRGGGDKLTRRQDHNAPRRRVSTSPRPRIPLITLLTDFGTSDYFVSAVKGVILSSNPRARIVDITHDIPPQDVEAAAFTLLAAYSAFAAGTIHVAVVDPGVGSSRRPILIQTRDRFFVGPDNGIFSYVCDQELQPGTPPQIFHLTNRQYFRHPVSATFNGRDVFAPVAAALSHGIEPVALGSQVTDIVRLSPLRPEISRDGRIKARIIHIDHFGNCVTNITQEELTAEMIARGAKLQVKGKQVKSFRSYFTEQSASGGKLFAIWGSAGFLEIAASNDSAARLLKARRGDPVIVSQSSESNL